MKHQSKKGRKFGRKIDQRKGLLRNLVNNLIIKEKIKTTLAKAKEAQKKTEKLITIAKKQDLNALRKISCVLPPKASKKLYNEIAPLYVKRNGGYTRIIKTMERRIKNAAQIVILELIKSE